MYCMKVTGCRISHEQFRITLAKQLLRGTQPHRRVPQTFDRTHKVAARNNFGRTDYCIAHCSVCFEALFSANKMHSDSSGSPKPLHVA